MSMGQRHHVVTLTDYMGVSGGAEKLALALTLRLDPERFRRTYVVSRWDWYDRERADVQRVLAQLEEAGVRFVGLRRGESRADTFALWAWRPLVGLLRGDGVDVVHAHKFGSNFWGSVLGRATRVPVVIAHEHSWAFEGQPLRRLIDRQVIARACDAFIAVSREDRRRMIELEGIAPEQVVLIPNGIVPEPPTAARDVRAELGIPAAAPVLVWVGVIRPEKRVDLVVRAVARLAPDFPELRALIVGPSHVEDQPQRLAAELGVESAVRVLGRREDIPDLVDAADLAVLASDREGTPLAMLEYMEAGKPIVATRVGGIPDLVTDGAEALLVEPGSPDALAEGIRALLDDRGRAARLGNRARERSRRDFDFQTMVERVESLYDELLARKCR
jgi:glycosyltransferase involved in cell wall biosynthesis